MPTLRVNHDSECRTPDGSKRDARHVGIAVAIPVMGRDDPDGCAQHERIRSRIAYSWLATTRPNRSLSVDGCIEAQNGDSARLVSEPSPR
jgi:hypothetical protein